MTFAIIVAVVWAFYRRYIEKLVRLKRGFYAGLVLVLIGGLMFSVLIGNGMAGYFHVRNLMHGGHRLHRSLPLFFNGFRQQRLSSFFILHGGLI